MELEAAFGTIANLFLTSAIWSLADCQQLGSLSDARHTAANRISSLDVARRLTGFRDGFGETNGSVVALVNAANGR